MCVVYATASLYIFSYSSLNSLESNSFSSSVLNSNFWYNCGHSGDRILGRIHRYLYHSHHRTTSDIFFSLAVQKHLRLAPLAPLAPGKASTRCLSITAEAHKTKYSNIADKLQPRNINVSFTNNSNVPIDVIIFAFYSDQLTIDVETGIVTK